MKIGWIIKPLSYCCNRDWKPRIIFKTKKEAMEFCRHYHDRIVGEHEIVKIWRKGDRR